eukprot:5602905-Pleurochrysis_carterae.AAC.1
MAERPVVEPTAGGFLGQSRCQCCPSQCLHLRHFEDHASPEYGLYFIGSASLRLLRRVEELE